MGSASYTKGAKRVGGGNHEWVGMNHEIHERHERKTQNHEWTRMGTNGKFRTTNGHEWARNVWEWNHEWTRMDTNGTTKYRSGTTKHTKYTKGKFRTTNGHEWARNVWEWNHERHELIV